MKTFVWIIGKPGSGKTTLGEYLAKNNKGFIHFSYGQLLKQVQPNPGIEGYSTSDRKRVNGVIIDAASSSNVVIVDGNPYSEIGFGFIEQIRNSFDQIKIVHLKLSDEVALNRLNSRNRTVLEHDGVSQADRIVNFNAKLLPLINEYKKTQDIIELEAVEYKDLESFANKVFESIK